MDSKGLPEQLPPNTQVVKVNYSRAEQQNGFMVYRVDELAAEDGKKYYRGFSIQKKVDPRYIYDDPRKEFYTARTWTDESVLVGYPAGTYEHFKHPESFKDEVEPGVYKAMDEERNRFVDNPSRLIEYTLLQFPHPDGGERGLSFKLSAKELFVNPTGDETELELQYFPVINTHAHGPAVESTMCVWNVARLDVSAAKRGKPLEPEMSKAAKQALERQNRKERERKERENASRSAAARHDGHTVDGNHSLYPDVAMSG
jgi:hypothetical protein